MPTDHDPPAAINNYQTINPEVSNQFEKTLNCFQSFNLKHYCLVKLRSKNPTFYVQFVNRVQDPVLQNGDPMRHSGPG